MKSWGARVLSSATTVDEALWLEAHGVDVIIAQGLEAGGHRGMFATRDHATQIGTIALVPLVAVMLQLAQYERESALASAEQRVKLIASLSADRQHRLVQRAHLALSEIAGSWQLLAARDSCDAVLAEAMVRHDWLTGIRVSSLDGSGVCADRPEILQLDIADRGYFRAVLAGQAFALGRIDKMQDSETAVHLEGAGHR